MIGKWSVLAEPGVLQRVLSRVDEERGIRGHSSDVNQFWAYRIKHMHRGKELDVAVSHNIKGGRRLSLKRLAPSLTLTLSSSHLPEMELSWANDITQHGENFTAHVEGRRVEPHVKRELIDLLREAKARLFDKNTYAHLPKEHHGRIREIDRQIAAALKKVK